MSTRRPGLLRSFRTVANIMLPNGRLEDKFVLADKTLGIEMVDEDADGGLRLFFARDIVTVPAHAVLQRTHEAVTGEPPACLTEQVLDDAANRAAESLGEPAIDIHPPLPPSGLDASVLDAPTVAAAQSANPAPRKRRRDKTEPGDTKP
jgi:hypothetical protein